MIEPGQKFTIRYGNGHELEVMALSMRGKRQIVSLIESIEGLEGSSGSRTALFDLVEEALKLCVPGVDLLDKIDEITAMEIITKTLSGQAIDDEIKKKSELPHSSGAVNSADVAVPDVLETTWV